MRNVLLDTQIFLWMQFETGKLPARLKEAMGEENIRWHLSRVSIWEVQIKYDLKKLSLPSSPGSLIPRLIRDSGLALAPLDNDAIFMLGKLPPVHRDPFDRLLVATALVNGWEIATADAVLEEYPVKIFPEG
jgi:PIN domain nuclease of toxin-antitoxin system